MLCIPKTDMQFWSHLWLRRLCSAETCVDNLWCLFVFNGAFLQVSSLFSNLQCAVHVSEGPSHKISAVIHPAELLLFCYRRRCIETCALTCQKLTCSMAPMLSSSRPGLHHETVEMEGPGSTPLSTLLFVLHVWTSRKIYYVLLLHWIPDVGCCISFLFSPGTGPKKPASKQNTSFKCTHMPAHTQFIEDQQDQGETVLKCWLTSEDQAASR